MNGEEIIYEIENTNEDKDENVITIDDINNELLYETIDDDGSTSSNENNEIYNAINRLTNYSEIVIPNILVVSCISFGLLLFFSFLFILFISLVYAF